jgi:hypothetical protein
MIKMPLIIAIAVFIIYAFKGFVLEGHVIDQLYKAQPKNYNKYLWFGTRLRSYYFLRQIKLGEIKDKTLLQFSEKLRAYILISLASWFCIILFFIIGEFW